MIQPRCLLLFSRPLALLLLAGCASAAAAQNAADSPDAPPASALAAPAAQAQDPSAARARAALEAMIQALGGDQWLQARNGYTEGRIASFYQGKPTGATVRYWAWHTPAAERIDLSEKNSDKHDWIQIYTGNDCWEITFRGKRPMPKDQCADAIRRRDHSIENVVRVWMKDPATVLLYEGQSLAERHLAIQVTLINAQNDSVTLQMDAGTHLPLRRTYDWRDPLYKDKNEEVEEYDDYHTIAGLPTPFTISRFHNGDETQQRFVFKAAYNQDLPANMFDPDDAATHFKKTK